jgi:hypothetical protein
MFTTLFGGGAAEMRLTDESNIGDSGIEIIASPPGKRLQNVLLLSGGEKSLTAMALLMAIFKYQPSPFCVLDEVDAPLDESNTVRLARLIEEMSLETQFVVITHHKRTMEAAQALYGVTMQEPGVSQLEACASVRRPPQSPPSPARWRLRPNPFVACVSPRVRTRTRGSPAPGARPDRRGGVRPDVLSISPSPPSPAKWRPRLQLRGRPAGG